MTPRIPDPTKIAEVHGIGQGSGNSTARRRAVVVRSLSPTQPFGRPHGTERERWPTARRWRVAARGRETRGMSCVLSSPVAPSLYREEGCTLAPLPKAPRAAAKGRGWQQPRGRWGQVSPQNPNPGWPGPGVHGASLFLPLMGFFEKICPLSEIPYFFIFLFHINSFN
jgi:hypothetical protein